MLPKDSLEMNTHISNECMEKSCECLICDITISQLCFEQLGFHVWVFISSPQCKPFGLPFLESLSVQVTGN